MLDEMPQRVAQLGLFNIYRALSTQASSSSLPRVQSRATNDMPTHGDLPDIFISYNHDERSIASALREELVRRGVPTFIDSNGLPLGASWPERLERALEAARKTIVLIGRNGLGGTQRKEVDLALDLQTRSPERRVIPVLLSGADPAIVPGFLRLNTWVDLRNVGQDRDKWNALAVALQNETPLPDESPEEICPYVGIQAFVEDQEAFFFGREHWVDLLMQKVFAYPIVSIVGPSGSGKSSVVSAGLVPRLRRIRHPEPVWTVCRFRPDQFPYRQFADALIRIAPASGTAGELAADLERGNGALESVAARIREASNGVGRLLVVIDQFEELFTLTRGPYRDPFIAALIGSAMGGSINLVITLRADFYSDTLRASRELADSMSNAQVTLGPLTPTELRAVIERPAALVGLRFEPNLVDRILASVIRQPGALPLLEYALTALWNERTGRLLTGAAYDHINGVEGALAQHAQRVADGLPAADVYYLFQRLVRVGRPGDEGGDSRRRAMRNEFTEQVWQTALTFAQPTTRLLVFGKDSDPGIETVEIAHEALIQHWEWWKDRIKADRDFLLFRQRLEPFVDTGALPDALRSEARRWSRDQRAVLLSAAERVVIQRSLEGSRRRTAALRTAAVVGVVLLLAGSALFVYWRTDANQVRLIAGDAAASRLSVLGSETALRYLRDLVLAGRAPLAQRLVEHDDARVAGSPAFFDDARLQVAEALLDVGDAPAASKVLENAANRQSWTVGEFERTYLVDRKFIWQTRLGIAWARAGERGRTREMLDRLRAVQPPPSLEALAARLELSSRANDPAHQDVTRASISELADRSDAVGILSVFAGALRRRGLHQEGQQALERALQLETQAQPKLGELESLYNALRQFNRPEAAAGIFESASARVWALPPSEERTGLLLELALLPFTTRAAVSPARLSAAVDRILNEITRIGDGDWLRNRFALTKVAFVWAASGNAERAYDLLRQYRDVFPQDVAAVDVMERLAGFERFDAALSLASYVRGEGETRERAQLAEIRVLALGGRHEQLANRLPGLIAYAARPHDKPGAGYEELGELGVELARHGDPEAASQAAKALQDLISTLPDRDRSRHLMRIATINAHLNKLRDARTIASGCDDSDRLEAYAAVLRAYAKLQSVRLRAIVERDESIIAGHDAASAKPQAR
jgi:hypothetical protein